MANAAVEVAQPRRTVRTAPPYEAASTSSTDPALRIRQAVLLLLLAFLVRMPSFSRPYWSPDEGYLGTEATLLREGGSMYEDVVDRKPPLLPWLYQASFAVTNSHGLWLVRVLAVVALALTGVLIARLAARWWGSWAEFPAGVLTVAGSAALPAPDAMAATFEIFMLPATAAAMYYGARGRFLLAGLAVAIATLTKQVGLVLLLPLSVQILLEHRRIRQGAALIAGVALPLALCALLLGVRPFIFWVFLSSGSYASSPPAAGEVIGRAVGSLICLLSAFAMCVLLAPLLPWRSRLRQLRPGVPAGQESAAILVRQRDSTQPGTSRALGLWLLASLAAVAVGWHFYGHYFLQLVPPMALGSLWLVDAAWRAGAAGPRKLRQLALARGRAGAATILVACALAAAALWTAAAVQTRPPQMDKVLKVVTAVEKHTAPGQKVLQWGMHPEIYWLSGRRPASRYLTAGLLTNFSGGGDPARVGARYAVPGIWARFSRELAESPPCLVVDDSSKTPYRLAEYPQLRELLAHDYQEIAVVEGARLYKRTAC